MPSPHGPAPLGRWVLSPLVLTRRRLTLIECSTTDVHDPTLGHHVAVALSGHMATVPTGRSLPVFATAYYACVFHFRQLGGTRTLTPLGQQFTVPREVLAQSGPTLMLRSEPCVTNDSYNPHRLDSMRL